MSHFRESSGHLVASLVRKAKTLKAFNCKQLLFYPDYHLPIRNFVTGKVFFFPHIMCMCIIMANNELHTSRPRRAGSDVNRNYAPVDTA
jgi:hypothetical protein